MLDLYQQHCIDKGDERLGLFRLLAERYPIRSALYAGSFTHVTPAFVFPTTCFVDMDKRAVRFFGDPAVLEFIKQRKSYDDEPVLRFHHGDYSTGFEEEDEAFDLLISQYAGFVSQGCKRYLKRGGYLLANNSHGDAGMAFLDPDYQLVAVINRRGDKFSFSEKDLDAYFIPKKESKITREYLERIGRGLGYTKSAFSYVFNRIA